MPGRGGRGRDARYCRSPPKYLNNSIPALPHGFKHGENTYDILDSLPTTPASNIEDNSPYTNSKHNFSPSTPPDIDKSNGSPINVSTPVKRLEKYFTNDISQLFNSMSTLDTPTHIKANHHLHIKKNWKMLTKFLTPSVQIYLSHNPLSWITV